MGQPQPQQGGRVDPLSVPEGLLSLSLSQTEDHSLPVCASALENAGFGFALVFAALV